MLTVVTGELRREIFSLKVDAGAVGHELSLKAKATVIKFDRA